MIRAYFKINEKYPHYYKPFNIILKTPPILKYKKALNMILKSGFAIQTFNQ